MQGKKRLFLWAAFGVYCLALLFVLFGRTALDIGKPYFEQVGMNINIIPFKTIRRYTNLLIYQRNVYLIPNAFINLFGNIVAFVPFGFFLPYLWKRLQSFKLLLVCSSIVIFIVELIQLFTLRGSCDIDDLILNLIGVICGFLLFRGCHWLQSRKRQSSGR